MLAYVWRERLRCLVSTSQVDEICVRPVGWTVALCAGLSTWDGKGLGSVVVDDMDDS